MPLAIKIQDLLFNQTVAYVAVNDFQTHHLNLIAKKPIQAICDSIKNILLAEQTRQMELKDKALREEALIWQKGKDDTEKATDALEAAKDNARFAIVQPQLTTLRRNLQNLDDNECKPAKARQEALQKEITEKSNQLNELRDRLDYVQHLIAHKVSQEHHNHDPHNHSHSHAHRHDHHCSHHHPAPVHVAHKHHTRFAQVYFTFNLVALRIQASNLQTRIRETQADISGIDKTLKTLNSSLNTYSKQRTNIERSISELEKEHIAIFDRNTLRANRELKRVERSTALISQKAPLEKILDANTYAQYTSAMVTEREALNHEVNQNMSYVLRESFTTYLAILSHNLNSLPLNVSEKQALETILPVVTRWLKVNEQYWNKFNDYNAALANSRKQNETISNLELQQSNIGVNITQYTSHNETLRVANTELSTTAKTSEFTAQRSANRAFRLVVIALTLCLPVGVPYLLGLPVILTQPVLALLVSASIVAVVSFVHYCHSYWYSSQSKTATAQIALNEAQISTNLSNSSHDAQRHTEIINQSLPAAKTSYEQAQQIETQLKSELDQLHAELQSLNGKITNTKPVSIAGNDGTLFTNKPGIPSAAFAGPEPSAPPAEDETHTPNN